MSPFKLFLCYMMNVIDIWVKKNICIVDFPSYTTAPSAYAQMNNNNNWRHVWKKVLTRFIITPAGDEPGILHHPLIIGHNVSLSGPANPSEIQTRLDSLACDFFWPVIKAPGLGKSITGGEGQNYFTFNYNANKVISLLTKLHHCRSKKVLGRIVRAMTLLSLSNSALITPLTA